MHPTLLHLGRFTLPTFGVLAAAGLMLALALSLRTATLVGPKPAGINPDALWDASLFALLSALVSSRLLLILANLTSFLSYPLIILALPSLTATGILLTLIATFVYLRIKKIPILSALDAWAPCATLTWSFLALGHLAEGSDPGLPTTLPWKILSPTGEAYLHPVALYTALAAALITFLVFNYLTRHPQPGHPTALALAASGIVQFLITFLRHPSYALDSNPSSLANLLDPIQWASLAMLIAAATLYLQTAPTRPNNPTPERMEHHAL